MKNNTHRLLLILGAIGLPSSAAVWGLQEAGLGFGMSFVAVLSLLIATGLSFNARAESRA